MEVYKEVQFWEPDDPKKNQFLVKYRSKFGCRVMEKVEDKPNEKN